ncbi:MAG: MBL fold metallo-hydrolase [Erysipelotrichaceae bacterium]
MIITTLIENTCDRPGLECEHGLSLLIQTKKHNILFDTGASGNFADNALKMNIDLAKVDIVIISHGHNDHGGGLRKLIELCPNVSIYIRKPAFDLHYSHRPPNAAKFIGLDQSLIKEGRFVFAGESLKIDEELTLFSDVDELRHRPRLNRNLTMIKDGKEMLDDFTHEQHLIIREDGNIVLIAGCAHQGIVNIIQKASSMGEMVTHVIGGFHLHNRTIGMSDDLEEIDIVAKILDKLSIHYYTCHCTGIQPYLRLKETLQEKIEYCSTGSVVSI